MGLPGSEVAPPLGNVRPIVMLLFELGGSYISFALSPHPHEQQEQARRKKSSHEILLMVGARDLHSELCNQVVLGIDP